MSDVLGRWVSVRDGLEIHSKRHAAALVKAGDALAARVVELEGRIGSLLDDNGKLQGDFLFERMERGKQLLDIQLRAEQAEQHAAALQRALEQIQGIQPN